MTSILLVICIVGILIIAGCVSPTSPVTSPTTGTPAATLSPTPGVTAVQSLIGDWNGTSTGYSFDQSEYRVYNDWLRMKVLTQDGSLFTGEFFFPDPNGTVITKEFAGVLGANGTMIGTVEYPDGFSNGVFLSADEIELVFRDDDDSSTISLDSLKRSPGAPKTVSPALPAMPSLVGSWNGTSIGYQERSGYQVVSGAITMEITSQEGRLFKGQVSYPANNTLVKKEFAGVLGVEGKTIQTIEYPDGFGNGAVVTADEIEIIFRDTLNPSRIAIDTFRRSSAPLTPAGKPTANLVGNWTGKSTGYAGNSSGYEPYTVNLSLKVTDQTDRLFKGQVSFLVNGTPVSKDVAGVFGRDGKTIQLVESPDGYSDGIVVTGDDLRLVYRDTSEPSDIAIDIFKRMA